MRLEMPGEGGGPDILEMSEGLKLAKARVDFFPGEMSEAFDPEEIGRAHV